MSEQQSDPSYNLSFNGPIVVSIVELKTLARRVTHLLFAAALLGLVGLGFALTNHDDTDFPGEHSGLTPRVDALTGCQYIESAHGVTPRLTHDGRPMCL